MRIVAAAVICVCFTIIYLINSTPPFSASNSPKSLNPEETLDFNIIPIPTNPNLNLVGNWLGSLDSNKQVKLIINNQNDKYFAGEMIILGGNDDIRVEIQGNYDEIDRKIYIRETDVISPSKDSWDLGFNQGFISSDGKDMNGTGEDTKNRKYSWHFSKID